MTKSIKQDSKQLCLNFIKHLSSKRGICFIANVSRSVFLNEFLNHQILGYANPETYLTLKKYGIFTSTEPVNELMKNVDLHQALEEIFSSRTASKELATGLTYEGRLSELKDLRKVDVDIEQVKAWLKENGFYTELYEDYFGFKDNYTFRLRETDGSWCVINFYPKPNEGSNEHFLFYALVLILKRKGVWKNGWIKAFITQQELIEEVENIKKNEDFHTKEFMRIDGNWLATTKSNLFNKKIPIEYKELFYSPNYNKKIKAYEFGIRVPFEI